MASTIRSIKLSKFFNSVCQGKQALTPQNSPLFIEAICAAPDAATLVSQLLSSSKGLSSLQDSMRFNTSAAFLNGPTTDLLKYLASSGVASYANGTFLNPVILAIIEPPIFWSPFLLALRSRQLCENALHAFSWLLHAITCLPDDQAQLQRKIAEDTDVMDLLLNCSHNETRALAQKIQHIIGSSVIDPTVSLQEGPGGRHDNDFPDFRNIAILPTADELSSKDKPFLRPCSYLEDPETKACRETVHLDNQFRLLREDLVYEMRDELDIAFQRKKGKHRGLIIDSLVVQGLFYQSEEGMLKKWGLTFTCPDPLKFFKGIDPADRKKFLRDNRTIWRHQSMTCLLVDQQIVAFPAVHRDEDLLCRVPPVVVLQFEGAATTTKLLASLSKAKYIKLLQINTAVFSYEPVLLALKEKKALSLSSELLLWESNSMLLKPPSCPDSLVSAIKARPWQDLCSLLGTSKSIILDQAQADSLLSALSQRVSLIQGPPGTGKSFIGALLAKILHDKSAQTILVVCYTNHALDQFLEDLISIGIPSTSMVRMGGKASVSTSHLGLQTLVKNSGYRRSKSTWQEIDAKKASTRRLGQQLEDTFREYTNSKIRNKDVLEHLQFDHADYFEAFRVLDSPDGMTQIGKDGKTISDDYLIHRWVSGQNAGIFQNSPHLLSNSQIQEIWNMNLGIRRKYWGSWLEEIQREIIDRFSSDAMQYNQCVSQIDCKLNESEGKMLREKRIIGCTTTGAAKYRADIRAARPGILLVEEAGEILESHILTALADDTQQLILIGDHKQLRPKVNNYALTVEKGEGYDLNRSLFERLVLKGYPHTTLVAQHRMRPEISAFVRHLTYPDLVDAPKTQNRPNLEGVLDNVVFIQHDQTELDDDELEERKDMSAKSSKQNKFEVQMVLKISRYLLQQGYKSEHLVILTPYLGQLRALRDAFRKDNDPVLNDLDSHELSRAGLLNPLSTAKRRPQIRLATIDNYQGEESDIVVASLTRSNPHNDIGFMSSPERVNVLLSRARNALIMIGNPHTFKNSRKGAEVWTKLFGLLEKNKHLYNGFPVRCQQHPTKTNLLRVPAEFSEHCPDGGCAQPCGVLLQCRVHTCSSKCHKLLDHSSVKCKHVVKSKCPRGHPQQWKCQGPTSPPCPRCDSEQKEDEKRLQEAFERQQKRDAEALEYANWIASIDAKLAEQREIQRDAELAEERRKAKEQKERDLQDAIAQNARKSFFSFFSSKPSSTTQGTQSPHPPQSSSTQSTRAVNSSTSPPRSSINSRAGDLWQYQKDVLGQNNRAIDEIIQMTGLEEVKLQVLRIKDKVDTSIRQNVPFTKERFNVAMLGNPGTGKTTVARLYGQFLASMQVLPGKQFLETTGARLANEGVSGAKQHIDAILKEGGGTIFIDEAYQLTADHIPGGKNVLDFLLAELENRVGQIVFIFAGYNKEMETFFEHNPGLPSRVPYTFQFKDYEDADLMHMLETMIEQHYQGRMKVDDNDGIRGLYGRIVVRRLGRGRGTKGFGNARALQNVFSKIRERQATRLAKARREGHPSDDFLLTKEDLVGPPPSKVMGESVAWKKLQGMIGLGEIKTSVKNFFDMVNMNYNRELLEKEPHKVSLNRVFLGSPGTGKTTVAKLYGQILTELGLLSSGEVVVKNPSDFVGNVLGASESQTKAILAATVGKVLVIDEAYMLYGGSKNGGQDSFKTAVIDTIVAEIQSVPGEDRCVLLLGYKEQMEEMFQNVNPGLSRRFAIEDAFHFKDYTEAELLQALEFKLKEHDLTTTDAAKKVAMDNLNRARNRPNFGNIGEVENLLNQAKIRYQARQALLPADQQSPDAPFEREDFDPEHDRNEHAAANLVKLFADVVGCDQIVEKLGNWQKIAKNVKALGKDPRDFIPTNFIFKGPPGTGKTTTARKMGQVYYDMGFLSSVEVVECSASDLVGKYVGHTGPQTKKLFEKALGHVLFIDEAYRLSQGQFAQEAIDEVVGILTQEKFRGKLIVILAGYDQDMNQLITMNSGLSSRFPEEIVFPNIPAEQCMKILKLKLLKENICLSILDDPSLGEYSTILNLLEDLSNLPSWGNARDIETLAKKMIEKVFMLPIGPNAATATIPLPVAEAISCINAMLTSRLERTGNLPPTRQSTSGLFATQQNTQSPPPLGTSAGTSTKASSKGAPGHSPEPPPTPAPVPQPPRSKANQRNKQKDSDTQRDSGVSDAEWEQLQRDRKAAEDAMNKVQEEQRKAQKVFEEAVKRAKEAEVRAKAEAEALAKAREQAVAAAILKQKEAEAAKRREAARIAEEKVRAEKARREAARKEAERKKAEEAAIQTKLRNMGVCVQGFRWIPQSGGYRCAGGSHFISNAQLGRN